jgi:hypothetical protein
MSVCGPKDGPPHRLPIAISDIAAGMHLAVAILAALEARHHTAADNWSKPRSWSRRCRSVSMRPPTSLPRASRRHDLVRRIAAAHPTRYSPRPTAGSRSEPRRRTSGSGCASAWTRPSSRPMRGFTSKCAARAQQRGARPSARAPLQEKPSARWLDALDAAGIPAGRVLEFDQAMADPHIAARGMAVASEHAAAGSFKTLGIPVKLSATTGRASPAGAASWRGGRGRRRLARF